MTEGAGCAPEQVARELVQRNDHCEAAFGVVQPVVMMASSAFFHQATEAVSHYPVTLFVS
jgi:hypothetical protein